MEDWSARIAGDGQYCVANLAGTWAHASVAKNPAISTNLELTDSMVLPGSRVHNLLKLRGLLGNRQSAKKGFPRFPKP